MSASTKKKMRQAAREAGNDKKAIAAQKEAELKAKSRRRWTLGTIAVVLLIALILFLNSGYLYKNTTAVSIGDENYSPAQVNYHYANQYFNLANQYGSYASLMGLDTSAGISGLDEQSCPMIEEGTWKDYLLDVAKVNMVQIQAVKGYAAENGISLTDEEKAAVDAEFASIEEFAKSQGYSNAGNFFAANYGNGVTEKLAREAGYESALVSKAITAFGETLDYTAAELEEKYDSFNGEMDYYDYAYYYVVAESVDDGEGNMAATDETKAEAQAKADQILDLYLAEENEDVEARLNAALSAAGVEAECTRSLTAGQSLGTYKDWVMAQSEAGEATVVANPAGTGFYVVAFIAHNDNDYALANARHILVMAAADENGQYTDEAKAEAKAKAEEIYAQWQAGEATEESFAQLANELSEDTGSNTNGGLYENIQKGQMVEEFDAFCFGGHKSGDTGIVYGESAGYAGYHVIYFVGEGENCRDYIARTQLENEDAQAWMDELVSPYEAVDGFWMKLVG